MIEYKYVFIDATQNYLKMCECCGSEAPLSKFSTPAFNTHLENEDMYLCEICSSSYISHALEYPYQISDPILYRCIAQVSNILLDKLTDRTKEIESLKNDN